MNWFVVVVAVLYLLATAWAAYQGEWRMALIWLCYGVASFALAPVRGA